MSRVVDDPAVLLLGADGDELGADAADQPCEVVVGERP